MSEYELTYANDKQIGLMNLVNIQADLCLFGNDYPSNGLDTGFLRNRIAANEVIVALDKQKNVAGFIVFEVKIRPHHYHVNQLSVAPDYLRQGIGQSLLERMIVEAKQKGGQRIGLTTTMSAAWGVNLYKKLGFKQKEFTDLSDKLYEKILNEVRHNKESKGYFELAL